MESPTYDILKSIELTQEYVSFLSEAAPCIQETLVSAFNNEMARNHRRKNFIKTVHPLDAILISVDNTNIELSDLTLPWLPDFKVIKLELDLVNTCLNIHFKLGDLTVNGNYEANSSSLQKQLPISQNGNIRVKFSDVAVQGRVGLLIRSDSFVTENYDISYTWNESEVTVKYFVNKDTEVENKVVSSSEGLIVADKIWLQLNEILTNILHEQLISLIVEYSVTEYLQDEDQTLRDFQKYQISKANGLLDTLLCSAKDYLVQKDYRRIETQPFQVIYHGKLTSTNQGDFHSGSGFVTDLSTLSRLTDLSLFEEGDQFLVYGTLGLRDFKHGYEHFTTKFESNELEGTISTQVNENCIFIKMSFQKGADNIPKPKIEKLEFRSLREIDVDSTGLGSLSWLIPKAKSWVIGHLRTSVLDTLLKTLNEAFTFAIDKEITKTHNNEPENEKSKLFWKSLFSK